MILANPPRTSLTVKSGRCWAVPVGVAALLLALAGCATPVGGAVSTGSPSASASASSSPEPSTSSTPSMSASTAPTSTMMPTPSVTPFSGDVLIVTSQVVGGDLEVTAMVPKVSEGDGTCTLELMSDGRTVSVGANEGKDVTYCGVMSISVGDSTDAPPFRVRYESPSTRAESAVSAVEPAP